MRDKLMSVIFVTCIALPLSLFAAPAEKKKPPAAPVVVAAAQRILMAPITWVAGEVISRNDARLATEVPGTVKKVAEVGDYVKEDDVVARIDNTFVKLRLEEFKAAVDREMAQLEFLREDVKRLRTLSQNNIAAKTQLEQTISERDVAQNNLTIARTRLQSAKEEHSRHAIRAPFAGVIAQRLVQPGERVDEGDEVVRLIDHKSVEVQSRVPLNISNYINDNMPLTLQVEQSEKVEITGHVRAIVPVGDERSRLMDLRIKFKDTSWRIGQPVRVALPTAKPKEVLAIPRDALVLRRSGTLVYRVNADNKAESVAVTLGVASGDLIEVIGDLSPGDKVVIRGSERLRPGQDVSIIAN